MRRNRFRPGDDAVSTVVGVVLLVGIAVVMMAAIGAFVLGFGPGDAPPETEIQFYEEGGNVTITVVRPAGISADNLEIQLNGSKADTKANSTWEDDLDRGDRTTVHDDDGSSIAPGSTVSVIWRSPSGGQTDLLGEYEVA